MIFLDEVAYPVFVPQNEGMTRPIKVIAPQGLDLQSDLSARRALLASARSQRAVDLALKALAPVLPNQVTAGNSAHLHFIAYSGFDKEQGEYWVYLEVDEGSYGGRPAADGLDAIDCLIANTRNNPIEELEWRFPMRTERYELRDEPCAAGRMARWDRHGPCQQDAGRHDRDLRRRPPRVRSALGHLRRPGWAQWVDRRQSRPRRGKILAREDHRED